MNNRIRLKGVLFLAAFMVSSYCLATGTSVIPAAAGTPADGSAVFAAKCATCHGKDGGGIPNWRAKGQPDFKDAKWQKSKTDAQIAEVTRNGKGKYMPAFKTKLSEEEITAVVARIRYFAKK